MQKLKYYTVCLTLCIIAVFLSYPNLSLSQAYNIEEAKKACEKYGGEYEEVDELGRFPLSCDIIAGSYDTLAQECQNIGGTFDFEANKCEIKPKIISNFTLQKSCEEANGEWINENCEFNRSIACRNAQGRLKGERCSFSKEDSYPFFTYAIYKEKYTQRLHKVTFHSAEDFYIDTTKKDSDDQVGDIHLREQSKVSIFRINAEIPGTCLHQIAQQQDEWDSSGDGPCVDKEGTPVTTATPDEDLLENIWVIFTKKGDSLGSKADRHGFQFTKTELEGEDRYCLVTDPRIGSGDGKYTVEWRKREDDKDSDSDLSAKYNFTDKDGEPTVPDDNICLKYNPDASKLFAIEEKSTTELSGVTP